MSEKLQESLQSYYDLLITNLPTLFTALILLLLFMIGGYFLHRLVRSRLKKRWKQIIVINFVANSIKWFFYLVGLVVAMDVLGFGGVITSLVTGAGISAIIIGFAFKDIAENFLAGILLSISRPFRVGNIIEVNGEKGTVRGMDLRTTHIRNVQGKDIYIPNAMIVKNVVANYTKDGLLRQAFTVGLDPDGDILAAIAVIQETLADIPEVLSSPETTIVVDQLGEFTVDISVFFWVDILKRTGASPSLLGMNTRSVAIQKVRDALMAKGHNMPSKIIEHKMYRSESPLQVAMASGEGK